MYDRVVAYITWGGRLLVFRHVDLPEAGIQVPAGRPEEGEGLEEAVLREAFEETGLEGLRLVSHLGTRMLDFTDRGGGIERRHFYHLEYGGEAPKTWTHNEENPSDGSPAPVVFELYWVDLDKKSRLDWGHGDLLDELRRTMLRDPGR
jgi:ADP-ribose pyrophosphatase YjhB (NUDIX family)